MKRKMKNVRVQGVRSQKMESADANQNNEPHGRV